MSNSKSEEINETRERFCKTTINMVQYLMKSYMPNILVQNKELYTDNCRRFCSGHKLENCIVTKYFGTN